MQRNISTPRKQRGLRTIDIRHGGYRAVYKVFVPNMVNYCRPASVSVTFVFFSVYRYCFVTRNPLNPGVFVALRWFGEYVSSFLFLTGFFGVRIRQCHR